MYTLCKILTCNVIFQSFCVFDLTIFSISNSTSSSVSSWYFDPPNFLFWSLSNVFPAKAFFNASRSKSYSVLGSDCFLQIKRNESVLKFSESKIKLIENLKFNSEHPNWIGRQNWGSLRSFRSGIVVVQTHTDLNDSIMSKKSLLYQNGLHLNIKGLEFIVMYSPSPFLSTFYYFDIFSCIFKLADRMRSMRVERSF